MKPPVLDLDLYADEVLADSTSVWARIREAGPVVRLPRHRRYAMGRFAHVRAALRDDAAYRSGHGVAANPLANSLGQDTTLGLLRYSFGLRAARVGAGSWAASVSMPRPAESSSRERLERW